MLFFYKGIPVTSHSDFQNHYQNANILGTNLIVEKKGYWCANNVMSLGNAINCPSYALCSMQKRMPIFI